MANVGFWVVAAVAGLVWSIPSRQGLGYDQLLGVLVSLFAIQTLFDFHAAHRCELAPNPRRIGAFLSVWARSAVVHCALLALTGTVILLSWRTFQSFVPGVLGMLGLLVVARPVLLRLTGAQWHSPIHSDGLEIVPVSTPVGAFTGGYVGVSRRSPLLVPVEWMSQLPLRELEAELLRRKFQRSAGHPLKAVSAAIIWNVAGAYLAQWVLAGNQLPAIQLLIGFASWMTLWTFLGLLVFPSWTHRAVFATDRAVGDSTPGLGDWIRRFPSLVGEDGHLSARMESTFYPIPSAERRFAMLQRPTPTSVWGDVARTNLYFSLCGLTPIGRAVHCNLGRPVCWILPPNT